MTYLYKFTYQKDPTVAGFKGPMSIQLSDYYFADGVVEAVDSRDLIKASIQRILNTVRGERVMQPWFGSNLRKILFEPLDAITLLQLKEDITNLINYQEPRIIVNDLSFHMDKENHTVYINLQFRYKREDIEESFDFYIS